MVYAVIFPALGLFAKPYSPSLVLTAHSRVRILKDPQQSLLIAKEIVSRLTRRYKTALSFSDELSKRRIWCR